MCAFKLHFNSTKLYNFSCLHFTFTLNALALLLRDDFSRFFPVNVWDTASAQQLGYLYIVPAHPFQFTLLKMLILFAYFFIYVDCVTPLEARLLCRGVLVTPVLLLVIKIKYTFHFPLLLKQGISGEAVLRLSPRAVALLTPTFDVVHEWPLSRVHR